MLYFTTYFDKNYLSKGIALYKSLKEQCLSLSFELHVLCLDNFTFEYFQDKMDEYPEVKALKLTELEERDVELRLCKPSRSIIEFYFTLSPCLPLFLLEKYNIPHICSLDADILFLDNPKPLFNYLSEYSIIITPHKFSSEIKSLEKQGVFNVSFQIFKNDKTGIECLRIWRNECIGWCGDYLDERNERFADQKYLDKWPELFKGKVKILNDNVSGLAPWNLNNFQVQKRGGLFYSENERIIFYHFHHFKFFNSKLASNGFYIYKVKNQKGVNKLYLEYWKKIKNNNDILGLKKDTPIRYKDNNSILIKILNENSIYFKILDRTLINIQLHKLPIILKKILIKLNA